MQVSDPTGKGETSFCQDQNLLEVLLGSVTNSDSSTRAFEVAELGDSESERMLGVVQRARCSQYVESEIKQKHVKDADYMVFPQNAPAMEKLKMKRGLLFLYRNILPQRAKTQV